MVSDNRYKIKCVISSLLSFLVCLLSFFLVFAVIFRITILNEKFMIKAMDKSNFYYQVKDEAEDKMALFSGTSGFDKEFFDGIIDIDMIKEDANSIVHSIYSNEYSDINVSDFKNMLYNNFIEEANNRNEEITDQTRESLEYFAETCVGNYLDVIKIPFYRQISSVINLFTKPIDIAIFVLSIAILFIGLFIFLISKWRSIRYYIYALEGLILFSIIIPSIYFISGKVQKISIANKALKNFIIKFMDMTFYQFIYASVIFLIFTIILMIFYSKLSNKKDNKS